jgi:hypothetical protein
MLQVSLLAGTNQQLGMAQIKLQQWLPDITGQHKATCMPQAKVNLIVL